MRPLLAVLILCSPLQAGHCFRCVRAPVRQKVIVQKQIIQQQVPYPYIKEQNIFLSAAVPAYNYQQAYATQQSAQREMQRLAARVTELYELSEQISQPQYQSYQMPAYQLPQQSCPGNQCGGSVANPPTQSPSEPPRFSLEQQSVVAASCLKCHGEQPKDNSFSLSDLAQLTYDEKEVALNKIRDGEMPKGGDPLSFREWIRAADEIFDNEQDLERYFQNQQ